MPNITDIFSSLHDSLAQLIKPSADSVMQMSWPGFALSPSDFKLQSNPTGPYDPQVAEETISEIADMIPAASEIKWENSGFEVHNVYEALVFGGIMKAAAPDAPASPLGKLFLDAQFDFLHAEKGSIQDPQAFYYPAKVTPVDWYSETSPSWAPFSLDQAQSKPATSVSPFIKFGGQQLVNQGVMRVAPSTFTNVQIHTQLQGAINARLLGNVVLHKPPIGPGVLTGPRPTVKVAPSIRVQVLSRANGTLADSAKIKSVLTDLHAQPAFKASLKPQSILERIKMPDASMIDARKMIVSPNAKFNFSQRVSLNHLITQGLPATPMQGAANNWKIQFRYCLVQLNRNWINTTLLNLPNWFFPGMKAGSFSAVVEGANPPQFPLLPQAFLAIRDLRINAAWSAEDLKNLNQSVSFGPFDLRSKVMNQNEVRVDGLQIIGWLSKRNPALAPMSDPSV